MLKYNHKHARPVRAARVKQNGIHSVRLAGDRGLHFLLIGLGLSLALASTPLLLAIVASGEPGYAALQMRALVSDLATAEIVLVGFFGTAGVLSLWRDRRTLDPKRKFLALRSHVAVVAAGASLLFLLVSGVVVGLVFLPSLVQAFRVPRDVAYVLSAVGLGLYLRWTAQHYGTPRWNAISIAAFILGVAGAFIAAGPFAGLHISSLAFGIGPLLSVASLALWFLVFASALGRPRRPEGTNAVAPT